MMNNMTNSNTPIVDYRTSAKDLVIPPIPMKKSLISFLVRILFLLVPFKSRFKTYRRACGGRWSPAEEFGYNNLIWVQVPTCPTKLFPFMPTPTRTETLRIWQRWYHAKYPNERIPETSDRFLTKLFGRDHYNIFPCHYLVNEEDQKNGKCYCEVYDDATE